MKEQLSDKEHYLTNINWKFHMKLTLTEPYPTTRPTTVSKSTESFFSLISSEIFVPTSAGRISIKVLQASFRIRLSWVGTSCQSFTGKRKVIFTNISKNISIQICFAHDFLPWEKIIGAFLFFSGKISQVCIPEWQVLNNVKWSPHSKQLSQSFPQL